MIGKEEDGEGVEVINKDGITNEAYIEQAIREFEEYLEEITAEMKMPEPPAGTDATDILGGYMAVRIMYAAIKTKFEKMLKDLDKEIMVAMITHGFEKERFVNGGHSMKITPGKNVYIGEEAVRRTMMTLEFDPDEINWFVDEVKSETPYDYIDVRKVGKGGKDGA